MLQRDQRSTYGLFTARRKAVRFIYGPLEGRTVHHTVRSRPVRRPYGSSYGSFTVCRKAVRFIYGLSEGCIVHSQPVGRPYGSSTAHRKAVRFILRTVSRTHGKLEAPFGRQSRRHLGRDFLCISFVFYGSVEATTEAIHRWFHFLSTASV